MISDALTRNVVGVWGDDGARWLANLPAIVRKLASDWDLTVGGPYDLSYHYVTAVTRGDGTRAVLKLGVPAGTSLAEKSCTATCTTTTSCAPRASRGWPSTRTASSATPGYEVGALLFNPDPEDRDEALTALVPSGVEQLADELAMPVDRRCGVGIRPKAVMSDVWSAEDWSSVADRSPIGRALDVARVAERSPAPAPPSRVRAAQEPR